MEQKIQDRVAEAVQKALVDSVKPAKEEKMEQKIQDRVAEALQKALGDSAKAAKKAEPTQAETQQDFMGQLTKALA